MRDRRFVLITGASGFIGHHLLAELLNRGRRCAALLRPPRERSVERLGRLLADFGIDLSAQVACEHVIAVEGDLTGDLPAVPDLPMGAVLHVAAATRFQPDRDGEPHRTNVAGTERLLEWADAHEVREFHLVSSAYVCGRTAEPVPERVQPDAPAFHNAYEESKWQAEQRCAEWGRRPGRSLTILRPSVVVGRFDTGRGTRFSGFYLLARATELLARAFANRDAQSRHSIPLRIGARASDRQNIVPVDYMAAAIASIVDTPADHGRVYHLVHPDPPTNGLIKQSLERYFDIAGGRFVPPGDLDISGLNEHERRFYDASRSIEHYFVDTPVFGRENTAAMEQRTGLHCPGYTPESIARLIAFAQSAEWGRPKERGDRSGPTCADYFERFLPRFVGRSQVARHTHLTTTVRFVIEDETAGEWVCRFESGRLAGVHRGRNGIREDFGYRASRRVFWEAITGCVHPQDLFLSGRAEVFGDVEAALKMAMILHAFTQEFPCDREVLVRMNDER